MLKNPKKKLNQTIKSHDFFVEAANPFCGPELVKYNDKPFPTSNCCGRELVERHGQILSWSYCHRCPNKIAPAPSPIYNDSREGGAA